MGYDIFDSAADLDVGGQFKASADMQVAAVTIEMNNPTPSHPSPITDRSGNVVWQPKV